MFFLLLLKQNVDGELFDVFLMKIYQEIRKKHVKLGEKEDQNIGGNLVLWLKELGVEQQSIEKIFLQDITLLDFQNHMSRDDLKTLSLPLGQEIRIWAKIVKYRSI